MTDGEPEAVKVAAKLPVAMSFTMAAPLAKNEARTLPVTSLAKSPAAPKVPTSPAVAACFTMGEPEARKVPTSPPAVETMTVGDPLPRKLAETVPVVGNRPLTDGTRPPHCLSLGW
jgi:hypothetical protein